ncbi:MAG TPA: hypothetical protein VE010_16220 [Thermoanaerobaculia bacterium]|nr:hypothetical protein [Thermoanaerobaculia bacterium]
MSVYVEAMLLLLPADAGGRTAPVSPREGSDRPYTLVDGHLGRARLFEGPPSLAPGDAARVMLELEADTADLVRDGAELQLLEHDQRVVGAVTILRVCRTTSV